MKVLVTGATGHVGASVVRELLSRNVSLRAFVRDRDQAVRRLGNGVELAVSDPSSRVSIDRALDGVDALFLACRNVPEQVEFECAAIDAAKTAGLTRIVKLSSPNPDVNSPLIFDRWHAQIEAHLVDSGMPAVTLRPRSFMTNLLAFAETIAQTGRLFVPAGDARVTYIDPRDVGAVAAAVLAAERAPEPIFSVTGPAISYHEIARDLSAATGHSIEYVDVSEQAARGGMIAAGMPDLMADFILGVFEAHRAGRMSVSTDTVRMLTGREPRSFAQFAHDHAAAFGGVGKRVAAISVSTA